MGYAGLTETISQLTEMQKEILVELQKVLLTLNMMYVYFLLFFRCWMMVSSILFLLLGDCFAIASSKFLLVALLDDIFL